MEAFRRVRLTLERQIDQLLAIPIFDPLEVEDTLASVQSISHKLEENHDDLLKTCPDSQIDDHIASLMVYTTKIRQINLKLRQAERAGSSSGTSTASSAPAPYEMRPPRMELPTFDGTPSNWPSFSQLFLDGVNAYPNLSGAQKLMLLTTSLKGAAKKVVSFIPPADNAFDEAWTLLKAKYEDKREISYGLINRVLLSTTATTSQALEQLVDNVREILRALSLMGFVDPPSVWLNAIILSKLDDETKTAYKRSLTDREVPTSESLLDFLQTWAKSKPTPSTSTSVPKAQAPKPTQDKRPPRAQLPQQQCPECKLSHALFRCPVYNQALIDDKWAIIKKHKICSNCINASHAISTCPTTSTCRQCQKKHHTSLHRDQAPEKKMAAACIDDDNVLLATLYVTVQDAQGKPHKLRALLDEGAHSSILSEKALQKLMLPTTVKHTAHVTAFGGSSTTDRQVTCTLLAPSGITFPIKATVSPQVGTSLPSASFSKHQLQDLLQGKKLADPDFNKPGPIDLILSCSVSVKITTGLTEKQDDLKAEETIFGWVLRGSYESPAPQRPKLAAFQSLHRFWEVEDMPSQSYLTPEEAATDNFVTSTTTIGPDGKFIMRMPLKSDPPLIGDSRRQAITRFLALERKFSRNPEFKEQYQEVMQEYFNLKHIESAPIHDSSRLSYLPHHAVVKPTATTSKLRIVFDASAKSANRRSLNDNQPTGPKLQVDIFDLLLRFRSHKVALTADIEKMYRCIWLHPLDRDLQRVIWRNDPHEDLQEYRLTTVTFGEAVAPYLAIKALHILAEETPDPEIARCLTQDFYVDDLLSGAQSIKEAQELQRKLDETLHSRGFKTHKWLSNSEQVLHDLPSSRKLPIHTQCIPGATTPTTLGISWNPTDDVFMVKISPSKKAKWTRRSVLSAANSLYDPLGWLAPVTVLAKLIMQEIVKITKNWDDDLPEPLTTQWTTWMRDLPQLRQARIPRHIPTSSSGTLCGFSDASEKAYGAVIYWRSPKNIVLVAAKTKVAPLKPITLPRLELLAAHLLATLMAHVAQALQVKKKDICAYTDSTVTLSWIREHPSRWRTFVANRVASIQQHIPPDQWQHIVSADNPADLCSRGVLPNQLATSDLWWKGPPWLPFTLDSGSHPLDVPQPPEEKINLVAVVARPPPDIAQRLLCQFSSYERLQRVVARLHMAARRLSQRIIPINMLRRADRTILLWVQEQAFPEDLQALRHNRQVALKSPLVKLNPMIDDQGILRVGGRLNNAKLSKSSAHPIILPRKHHVTKLLIQRDHLQNLHAGPTLTNHTLLQRFWILQAQTAIKQIIRSCTTCTRFKAKLSQQMMADLPPSRVQPVSRPFTRTGVDYAGPFELKTQLARSTRTYKAYTAIFVCFTTRAIHLELITALTSSAFLAGLSRFASRRGVPAHMYSDRGTNFVGAERELAAIAETDPVQNDIARKGISWHFNPPSAPHMGGIWEAGVKSMKTHLRKVIGKTTLTYEEFSTILCRIEAALNSRPLQPMSNDAEQLDALTPAHFLIGTPIFNLPEEDLQEEQLNHLSRWQMVQQLAQNLWSRWSKEYLTRLQQRPKWWRKYPNLQPGTMVLVQDANLPPLHWKLARILKIHPANDATVRVVTIKTALGEMQRPIHKLCPLPLDGEDAAQLDVSPKPDAEPILRRSPRLQTLKPTRLQGGEDVGNQQQLHNEKKKKKR